MLPPVSPALFDVMKNIMPVGEENVGYLPVSYPGMFVKFKNSEEFRGIVLRFLDSPGTCQISSSIFRFGKDVFAVYMKIFHAQVNIDRDGNVLTVFDLENTTMEQVENFFQEYPGSPEIVVID